MSATPTEGRSLWTSIQQTPVLLLISALLTFGMWFFVDRVWAPPNEIHFSDLYPSWYGSKELLLHGRDPYGPAVTREIQAWTDGHALDAEITLGTRNEHRFAYPLYLTFVLAPTVRLPYPKVQRLFRWIMAALVLLSVPLWIMALRWNCSRTVLGSLTLLSFGSFPALESIYLQQPVVLATALLAGSAAALTTGHLFLAGALLAFATIKPQLTGLLVMWLMLWAFSDWRARKRLVWGFAITMLALIGASELFLPGWIREFAAGVLAYQRYTGNFSILTLYFGTFGSTLASVALAAGLACVALQMRHEPGGSDGFSLAFCLVLTATLVVIPTIYPTGQLLLLPPTFWFLKHFPFIWANGYASRLACVAVLGLIVWPWVGCSVFMLAHFAVPAILIRQFWIVPVSTLLLVPSAMLVLFSILTPAMLRARTKTPAS
jgi:glycosyl transferase family 87